MTFVRYCELTNVWKDGSVLLFPICRFMFSCVVSFQMVMSIRFLGFMVVIKHVLE